MAPQPYFTKTHGYLIFGPEAAKKRPELAAKVAEMFAQSVMIELETIQALSVMLGDNSGPATAIFAALRTANLQLTAIEAVADQVLSDRDAELFVAVTDETQRANVDRNRFAHWHWGYLGNDEDAICVQDPAFRRKYNLESSPLVRDALESREGWERMQLEDALKDRRDQTVKVLVYRSKDLDDSLKRMVEARYTMSAFASLIDPKMPGHGEPQLYDDLTARPGVAEALARHRKNRAKKR